MGELLLSGVTERDEFGLNTRLTGVPLSGETVQSGLEGGVLAVDRAEFWIIVILCLGEAPLVGMTAVLV